MPGSLLKNRYFFKGIIILETALHIGGGEVGYANTDNAVVKTVDKKPYIPGSSLKGAFRSMVERIVANFGEKLSCGLTVDSDYCLTGNEILQESYKNECNNKNKSEEDLLKFLEEKLCSTCKLFGSPFLAAKVSFSDAKIIEELWGGILEKRDGVGIDRDSKTAVNQCKFDYEAVPAESIFEFELRGENLLPEELGILAIGILEMAAGMFSLGGLSSRGLGRCRLELEEISYIDDFANLELLQKYIQKREMLCITKKDEQKKFLQQSINSFLEVTRRNENCSSK